MISRLPLLTGLLLSTSALLGCPPRAVVKPTEQASAPPIAAPRGPDDATPSARAPGADAEADGPLDAAPVYFSLDSALLAPGGQEQLATIAERLRRREAVRIRIQGHTCELGTAEYNLALGLRRAQVTKEFLVRMGVAPERIQIVSFGEEQPADEGSTEEALAKNRRSELSFELGDRRSDG